MRIESVLCGAWFGDVLDKQKSPEGPRILSDENWICSVEHGLEMP